MADGGPGMCWYLRRCGRSEESLPLPDGEEVTMGRGLGVTYQLKPTLCPLMISRTHCLFKQNVRGEWTVTDNKSLNGVWRNKERLEPHKAYTLSVKELKQIFQQEQHNMGGRKRAEEEEHLKEQLAQALQEHTQLMQELNRNKNDFEQIIQAKNKELQETKEEKEKVRAQKEEVLNHMNDVLDNELQCIICSEHFIEAVTLNCAHSFCSYCIKSWRKRKEECPICRQEILSETRSLVLDNCIDSMVAKLSPEMKNRRAALILERKEMVQVEEPSPILVGSDSSSFHFSSSSSDSDELFWLVNDEEEEEEEEEFYQESLFDCGTDDLDSSDFESDDDDDEEGHF
ncbi:E3 ubiquitin-protein ligase RNF8 [Xenopus tropicalis]|uniref:E3 ubiquitin-protein ligase CHFR n=1 Tax=Xenopus tropicalis TaxID=8364 RepID=B4F701_XENTR|nr:E3 ubiquitin-protein ligase RNF8 [Xenopus tropicalis]AAI68076.1 Unknown (protein for MGC:185901) [Xenopus tropicalis]|eukprot:NP_001135572.1 E3 ubiquitin-protein ligase RNF8 [Xenopus tropicalis]